MRLFKKTNIDFIGKRFFWYVVSTIMVLIGLVSIIFKGINYGIDFQGGTGNDCGVQSQCRCRKRAYCTR